MIYFVVVVAVVVIYFVVVVAVIVALDYRGCSLLSTVVVVYLFVRYISCFASMSMKNKLSTCL